MNVSGINEKTDSELYESFLLGNTDSYDVLIRRYIRSITKFLSSFLRNPQDAEDVMIESFARIMSKKPVIKVGYFRAYLYKTARNLAIRYNNKMLKHACFSLEDISEEPVESVLIEDLVVKKEKAAALHQALNSIKSQYKEVMWLFYFERLSYLEIAKILGVNVKRIDHLLEKGRKEIKRKLTKEGFTYEN